MNIIITNHLANILKLLRKPDKVTVNYYDMINLIVFGFEKDYQLNKCLVTADGSSSKS